MFLNPRKGQGPMIASDVKISLVDYKLAGPPKLCNGLPHVSIRDPEDP